MPVLKGMRRRGYAALGNDGFRRELKGRRTALHERGKADFCIRAVALPLCSFQPILGAPNRCALREKQQQRAGRHVLDDDDAHSDHVPGALW
jgi:hypothetical protein